MCRLETLKISYFFWQPDPSRENRSPAHIPTKSPTWRNTHGEENHFWFGSPFLPPCEIFRQGAEKEIKRNFFDHPSSSLSSLFHLFTGREGRKGDSKISRRLPIIYSAFHEKNHIQSELIRFFGEMLKWQMYLLRGNLTYFRTLFLRCHSFFRQARFFAQQCRRTNGCVNFLCLA